MSVRVVVDDLDTVLPFYEHLAGEPAQRSAYGDVAIARVGGFVLLSGPETALVGLTRVRATVHVEDVATVVALAEEHGGEVLAGPHATSTGSSAIVAHPDGNVFEYVDRSST